MGVGILLASESPNARPSGRDSFPKGGKDKKKQPRKIFRTSFKEGKTKYQGLGRVKEKNAFYFLLLFENAKSCPTLALCAVTLRPLCPWDSPVKNTAVGCHALLQGIS